MTPVHRTLAGDVLAFDLAEESRTVREELAATQTRIAHPRIARTLVKEGPLRLTLVGVGPGGALREHQADGPVSIHVLEGEIVLDAGGQSRTLPAGSLAALDAGVRHAVRSEPGGLFLLTVAAPASASGTA
ncbi:MAG TPA: cupin domain-containing protein [Gemmatimonadaceae bacterium]